MSRALVEQPAARRRLGTTQPPAGTAPRGRVLQLARSPATEEPIDKIVNDFQSDTAEIIGGPDPILARGTLFALIFMFIAAVTWSALSSIDRIVSARGKLITNEPSILVQPFDTAVIRSLNVKEGDVVKQGTVLVTLDPTFSASDVAQLQSKLESLDAQVARLDAERANQPMQIDTATATEAARLQYALWRQRQLEYSSRLAAYDENIARTRVQRQSKEREIAQLKGQQGIVREIEAMRRQLAAAETGSRLNLLLAQVESSNIARSISMAEGEVDQAGHQLQSLTAERDVYVKQWSSQIANDLVRLRDEQTSVAEQLNKARKRLSFVDLQTPVDAIVLEIAKRSVGSVVTSAEPLMRLVPLNAPLQVEAFIPAKDIGHVKITDDISIKLDAYPFTEHGLLKGRFASISEDTVPDASGSSVSQVAPQPAYKARIDIEDATLRNVPSNFRLIPGMPLVAEIKVGDRSVLNYFLRPIFRGLDEGMREP